jgi:serine/threonine-protein kinase HipA
MKVKVHLGDKAIQAGTLFFEAKGNRAISGFEYEAGWRETPHAFAIDPALPLRAGLQYRSRPKARTHASVFFGAIADTEPDGWGRRVIVRDWMKQREAGQAETPSGLTPTMNALDYLLSVDDVSRVGALRYRIDDGEFLRASEKGRRNTPPLIELTDLLAATHAVERNDETAGDLRYLRGCGTSLGGLRPKCSVVDDEGALSIAKFPSVTDERAVTKAEVLALDLARVAGIDAAAARLVHVDDKPVALIRRFDRLPHGRIMFVSAQTLLGVDDDEEHAYTEIAAAIRQHGGARAATDIHELWRRIVFSVLVTNTDDHLKNHGFLHAGRDQWRLSPAYDINPTPDKIRDLKTWISEDTGPQATIEAAFDAARYFGLKPEEARAILAEVERAVATWRAAAARTGMTPYEIDQFADAFEHPERVKAQSMLRKGAAAGSGKSVRDKSIGKAKR